MMKKQLLFNKGQLFVFTFLLFTSVNSMAQSFAPAVSNPFGLTKLYRNCLPELVDLDADGDLDMLASDFDGKYQYFENVGTPTVCEYAAVVENPFGLVPGNLSIITLADLDDDGDVDMISTDGGANYGYFENIGSATTPAFATPVWNVFGLQCLQDLTGEFWALAEFADLDADGDYDLLATNYVGDIFYYENSGSAALPFFNTPVSNPFGLQPIFMDGDPALVDFDSDGDLDLFFGMYQGGVKYFLKTIITRN